uniref:Uncharacterized protein n=1 Tax=viral metagenome TaxID=1070528 RepID=A0A6M3KI97_9ZZZZ
MAFTASKLFHTILGDKQVGGYTLTGDAADTTWDAPIGKVEAAWCENGDNSTAPAVVTWSGATLTITVGSSVAIASGKYIYAYYVGV